MLFQIRCIAMCAVFPAVVCYAAPDKAVEKPSITIRISTQADEVALGSEIKIDIAVTNVSAQEISLPADKSDKAELCGFRVVLLGDAPSNIKMTKYHWELTGRRAPKEKVLNPDENIVIEDSVGPVQMEPGRTIDYYSKLNDLYHVNTPGVYKVQVEKADPVTNAVVKSNVLVLTVKGHP